MNAKQKAKAAKLAAAAIAAQSDVSPESTAPSTDGTSAAPVVEPIPPIVQAFDSTAGLLAIRASLAHRGAMNPQQASFFAKEAGLWNAPTVQSLHDKGIDVSALATLMRNPTSGMSDTGFLAKYAVDKVRKIALAVAQGSFHVMDIYTQGIVYNMRKLGTLTAPSALVALSRACAYKDADIVQNVKAYTNKTAGTASTQRSSSREAMRALGIANVNKNRRDDTIALCDSPMALAVITLADSVLTAPATA